MEQYRDLVAEAVQSLGHEVIRAEDFGSLPDSPQSACLSGVRRADVVVLLMGARYGAIQNSGNSATHEEYLEALERCPVLVMVQEIEQRDDQQRQFLEEVQRWSTGSYS